MSFQVTKQLVICEQVHLNAYWRRRRPLGRRRLLQFLACARTCPQWVSVGLCKPRRKQPTMTLHCWFTLLAQKYFGVVTTLHCWGSHSHCSTMIKPKDNPLQLCCLWQLCEDECCTISTLKLLPAYIVSYHSDYNEPQTSNFIINYIFNKCWDSWKYY